jgi:hypothetical protein
LHERATGRVIGAGKLNQRGLKIADINRGLVVYTINDSCERPVVNFDTTFGIADRIQVAEGGEILPL